MLRAFANLPGRQVHYRTGGAGGVPLLMLHGSPGSAKQLERLGDALAATRHVLAPDRPGNGDSARLDMAVPEIIDYARADLAFLDCLGVEQVDVYGTHTGASVAVELALLAPERVRRVILDGIALFSQAEVEQYLARYAPAKEPDLQGTHLAWAFQFCRDQFLFFPWFDAQAEKARGIGLPPAQLLHDFVLEVLKAISTYHLGYKAAFRHDMRARLPLLRHPVLAVAASDDPLLPHLPQALALLPQAQTASLGPLRAPGALAAICGVFERFLAA